MAGHTAYPGHLTKRFNFSQEKLSKAKFLKSNLLNKNIKGDIISDSASGDEPKNWFNLSPDEDSIQGVSTEKLYKNFGQPFEEVIVAVIDSGVDVNHEDLQGKVWINEDEIPNNNIDDDNNGYIDDVYGWNFIGGKKGMATFKRDNSINGIKLIKGDPAYQVNSDTLEMTREVKRLRELKEDLAKDGYYLLPEEVKKLKELSEIVESKSKSASRYFKTLSQEKKSYEEGLEVLKAAGLKTYTMEAVSNFEPQNSEQEQAKQKMMSIYAQGYSHDEIYEYYDYFKAQALFHYNLESDTRSTIVGDNIKDKYERDYGNNDVIGPDSSHGTHVAGIIAAARNNGIGMNGVASNVKIMAIRAVPNGDERDKDVANSIYYAVDNGAKVINMSFGKSYSPYKDIVDEAVEYARSKGVLLVHAAGNDSKDLDENDNFPNKIVNGEPVENWLEVGASAFMNGPLLPASFSNYGKTTVDIFAPGKNIYATFPDNEYKTISGTSMASPVVAGVAALILGYLPELTAAELKEAIMSSSDRQANLKVVSPGSEMVFFSELSVSGGVANAFEALNTLTRDTQVPYRVKLAGI
ncbi:MAG: peptidase S8 [Halobacteriovoraceae bacterium]|nr:peptidase S8 [Halobacteriovoraceae bacterium]